MWDLGFLDLSRKHKEKADFSGFGSRHQTLGFRTAPLTRVTEPGRLGFPFISCSLGSFCNLTMSTPATKTGITVKDVDAADFVAAYARYLKRSGKVPLPQWVDLVKTSSWKELSPYEDDWYYIRCGKFLIRNI